MSEKLHHRSPENQKPTTERVRHQEKENLRHLQERAQNASETSNNELQAIKKSIEHAAVSGKEYTIGERESSPGSSHSHTITKSLKRSAYKKTLKRAQSQLTNSEKTFSKVIHISLVEKTSEVAAKTVARPSGILFGGIGALIGSLVILYISKRSGFTYNYLVYFLIFVGCYTFGLLMEIFLQLIRPSTRRKN